MRLLPRFHVLPLLIAACLGGACTDPDDESPPKLVAVANETPAAHRVEFGITEYGSVAAGATTGYEVVADGENAVRVDGVEVWRDSLGSDNVGGMWTLFLQDANGQLLVGIALDQ